MGTPLKSFQRAIWRGMLKLAAGKTKRPSETDDLLDQIQLVAGACSPLCLAFTRTAV
jgi:hypothetical protein